MKAISKLTSGDKDPTLLSPGEEDPTPLIPGDSIGDRTGSIFGDCPGVDVELLGLEPLAA